MMVAGARMALVANERWKLTATALNGLAVATMVTGFVAPLVAVSYGVSGAPGNAYFTAVGLAWFSVAFALHIAARFVLRRLKE